MKIMRDDIPMTMAEALTNLADVMNKACGTGYMDRPILGIVIAVSIEPDAELVERVRREHNREAGVVVTGLVLKDGPQALATFLHGSGFAEKFMADTDDHLEDLAIDKVQGQDPMHTLHERRIPKPSNDEPLRDRSPEGPSDPEGQ